MRNVAYWKVPDSHVYRKQLAVMYLLSLEDTSFSASPRQGFAKEDRIYIGLMPQVRRLGLASTQKLTTRTDVKCNSSM